MPWLWLFVALFSVETATRAWELPLDSHPYCANTPVAQAETISLDGEAIVSPRATNYRTERRLGTGQPAAFSPFGARGPRSALGAMAGQQTSRWGLVSGRERYQLLSIFRC
ncbi:MAG: hypothetical protein KatS3mg077_2322 [Candidatus Binatia bacterium]|nr:MAG: hypothetical protein KatS3mg077_2322 [Candidatus Binatia bacterium]